MFLSLMQKTKLKCCARIEEIERNNMTQINFIVCEMTFLRYFIPLVIEGNKRGIKSIFFVGRTGKYNSPHKHQESLNNLSKKYDFELRDISKLEDNGMPFFLIEGVRSNLLSGFKGKKYSLTYMTDFTSHHGRYVDMVDHVILPSQFMAEYHQVVSQKNLYLGSPKYDVSFNNEEICKKYNLNLNKRKAFVILPRARDIHNMAVSAGGPSKTIVKIYESLRNMGLDIVTKTRGKDIYDRRAYICGDHHFVDFSWYPHDSMELMHVSDLIINFSSTAIKECVLLKRPLINFHIKPFKRPLDILYNYDYCIEMSNNFVSNKIEDAANFLLKTDLDDSFNKSIENHLFTGNSSKRILDYLEQK